VKPIRFYENELQDTKQMFPFSLWSATNILKGYFRVTVRMRATNTCAHPCHVSREQLSQFKFLCRLATSN
jgi:hypothetical protein